MVYVVMNLYHYVKYVKCIFGFSLDLHCVTSSVRKVELRTHVHDVIMSIRFMLQD